MKKFCLALLISMILSDAAQGQSDSLIIKNGKKGLYIDHTVIPREGLFAVGRQYNVHPKAIADYNDIDMAKGLMVGQVLHIPLTDTNFTQAIRSTGKPVYYQVGQKENLEAISKTVNEVPVERLRAWNKLPDNSIRAGSKLVVGFLVLETGMSSAPTQNGNATDRVAENKPAEKTASGKEDPPRQEPVTMKNESTPATVAQGYFKPAFDQQVIQSPVSKEETVTSGIFRVNSGLQEARYYLLVDKATPGMIIRISNPANSRTVYAKVLGQMSGIRQNEGLDIRISDSAAATLGITDTDKFIVKISY